MNEPAVNRLFHRRRPTGCLKLAEQALDVRLHSTLGNPEVVRDDFVAFALCDEFQNVHLAWGQYGTAHILHKLLSDAWWNTGFAAMHLPDRFHKHGTGSVFEQIAARSRFDGQMNVLFAFECRENDHPTGTL